MPPITPISDRAKQNPALLKTLCRFSKQALAEYAITTRFMTTEERMLSFVSALDRQLNAIEYDALTKKIAALFARIPDRLKGDRSGEIVQHEGRRSIEEDHRERQAKARRQVRGRS